MSKLSLPPLSAMPAGVQAAFRAIAAWAASQEVETRTRIETVVRDTNQVIARNQTALVEQATRVTRAPISSEGIVRAVLSNSAIGNPIEMYSSVVFRAGTSETGVAIGAGGIGGTNAGDVTWAVSSADGSFFFGRTDAGNIDPAHLQIIFDATAGTFQFGKDIVVQTSSGSKTLDLIAAGATGYTTTQLQNDLASGVNNIIASTGGDFDLTINDEIAGISIGHKDSVYGGYSAVADNTNTRLPIIALTAGGIAMGYNDINGNWVDSVVVDAINGTAYFSGSINATSGNFTGTINTGSLIVDGVQVQGGVSIIPTDTSFVPVTFDGLIEGQTVGSILEKIEGEISEISLTPTLSGRIDLLDTNGPADMANGLIAKIRSNVGDITDIRNSANTIAESLLETALKVQYNTDLLYDAGVTVDSGTGNVYIYGLETYKGINDSRVAIAEAQIGDTISDVLDAQAAIALKASQIDLAALTGRVSAAEIDINAAEASILLKASSSSVTALDARLGTAEIDINAAEAAITLKADSIVVTSIESRLSAAEIDINAAEASIALKASSATVTDLDTRLGAAEIDIDGLNSQIILKATNAYVDDKVAAVAAAATPFATYSFNGSLDAWTSSAATLSTGATAVTFDCTGSGATFESPTISAAGSTNTVVTLRIKRTAGTGFGIVLQWKHSGHGYSSTYQMSAGSAVDLAEYRVFQWLMSDTADWTANTLTGFRFTLGESAADTFLIDAVEIGPRALFSLLLSDVELRISSAEIDINAVQSAITLKADSTVVADHALRLGAAEVDISAAEAAILLKASSTTVTAIDSRLSAAEVDINAAQSAITLKADASVVSDHAIRLSVAEVDIDAANAAILLKASTTTVSAIDSRLGTAEADIDAAQAAILLKASQLSVDSQGTRLSTAETEINALQSEIVSKVENATFTAADARLTTAESRITAYDNAGIINTVSDIRYLNKQAEEDASALLTSVLNGEYTLTETRASIAAARNELTAYVDANNVAEAAARLELATIVNGNIAAISAEQSARSDADTALASSIEALGVTVGSNAAAITTEATARATADSATALLVTNLTTTVGGNTASILSQSESINGMLAQHVLALNVNGKISGYKAMNNGAISSFAIEADQFFITNSANSTNKKPFAYYTVPTLVDGVNLPAGMYLDSAYIGSLNADKIKAGTILADSIIVGGVDIMTLGAVKAAAIRGNTALQADDLTNSLATGVGNVLAGVGGNYRADASADNGWVLLRHKDVVYGHSIGGSGYSGALRTAVGVTANGVVMGYNRKSDGNWVNSISIDATTGDAAFLGGITATSGTFVESITVGDTTLGTIKSNASTGVANAAAAQAKADAAFENAATAQSAADGANLVVADMASDDKFTPVEKTIYRSSWDVIADEKAGLNSQATTFGVTTENTTYDTTFQALATYLHAGVAWVSTAVSGVPNWISDANLSVTTDIVGSTFRSKFGDYAAARTALLNAISAKAKALADAAKGIADSAVQPATLTTTLSSYVTGTALTSALGSYATTTSLSDYLSKSADTIMATGFHLKTPNYDSVTAGHGGLAIYNGGIVARKRNAANTGWDSTVTIDTNGNAIFAGDVITGGNARFDGVNSGSGDASVQLDGYSYIVDYSVLALAETPASSPSKMRAAVYGYAGNQTTGNYFVGGVFSSPHATKGWGVIAQGGNVGVAGIATEYLGAGVIAKNTFSDIYGNKGVALSIYGRMTTDNSTLVANLNADKLDGLHAKAGDDPSWGVIPVIKEDGVMNIGPYIDFHLTSTPKTNGVDMDFDFKGRLQITTDNRLAFIYPISIDQFGSVTYVTKYLTMS